MPMRSMLGLAVFVVSSFRSPAVARVSGGAATPSDCYAEFDGVTETSRGVVDCTDGDPSCDADGSADGKCEFQITVCAAQTDIPGCTPKPIEKFSQNVLHLALPAVPVTTATCGAPNAVRVRLRGRVHKRRSLPVTVKLRARSSGLPALDANRFKLLCTPPSVTTTTIGTTTTTTEPCPAAADGPSELDLVVTEGSDLDLGWTGVSHDFLVPVGTTFRFCASGCDAATDPLCDLSGTTAVGGAPSLNGTAFGAPLPLVAGGLPVCVVNRYAEATITGQGNLQTGEISAHVKLSSDVWVTPTLSVCPKCTGSTIGASGTCSSGPRKGQACTTEGIVTVNSDNPPISNALYTLSRDCPPGGLAQIKVATLPVDLDPLTTATSTLTGAKPCAGQTQDDSCGAASCTASCLPSPPVKGGVHQLCCQNAQHTPCFATAGGGEIVRTGAPEIPTPAWPDAAYPKVGVGGEAGMRLVSVFCVDRTNAAVDGVSGLPGPGAVILPVAQCWRRPGQACP